MNSHARHSRPGTRSPGPIGASLAAVALLACADARAADCLVTTTGVAFGVYDPVLTTPTDSTGNLTVRCTHEGRSATRLTYTVELSTGSSGSYAQRQMRSGSAVLRYNLFDSATYARVWGNGTGGSGLVAGTLVVNPGHFVVNEFRHPIYGRIPAQQAVDSGSYSDTILVTLTF
jgi:spore coat protein U-like protein